MPLPAVCSRHPGDADPTPHPRCSCGVAQEQGEPRGHLAALGLRPPLTALACQAGRVHHDLRHPLGHSPAVEPPALPPRRLAPDDAGVRGSATPRLGPRALRRPDLHRPGWPTARPRPRCRPGRDAPVPGRAAEFNGPNQGRPSGRGLIRTGRCGWRQCWAPSCLVQPMRSHTCAGASHQRPVCVLSPCRGSQALRHHAAPMLLGC